MIQPLRRAHFRIWVVLAVWLYALFIAGLLVRRTSTPPNPNIRWEPALPGLRSNSLEPKKSSPDGITWNRTLVNRRVNQRVNRR